jgi:hypothetical protein
MTEYFNVIRLHRDDLAPYLSEKKRDELTDGQMERFARRLGEALMDNWDDTLEALIEFNLK